MSISDRAALLFAAGLASACGGGSELALTLELSDSVYVATSSARITISAAEAPGFPLDLTRRELAPGLELSNRDVDGDGRVDIVLELTERFDLKQTTRFTLHPNDLLVATNVIIRAEAFDARHNRVARLGGASRLAEGEHVTTVLSPGAHITVPTLSPACVSSCSDATARLGAGDVGQTFDLAGAAPTALAAGAFVELGRSALAIGAADATTPATAARVSQPRAGRVELWAGSGGPLTRRAALTGRDAGDRLGAALATADLDGDGVDELIIGVPGQEGGRGALWILYGPISDATSVTGVAERVEVRGPVAGAELGATLAVEDLDGDGRAELLVGAPGVATVYALQASDMARGQAAFALSTSAGASIIGVDGSRFGAALSARHGAVAVGAPLEGAGAAYHVRAAGFVPGTQRSAAEVGARWPGVGGGFGSAVLLGDLDGDGRLALFVGAPFDGAGRILGRAVGQWPAGAIDAMTPTVSVRGSIDGSRLGATLDAVRGGLGDWMLIGEAASTTQRGRSFALPLVATQVDPTIAFDAEGRPAQLVVSGGGLGDGFGTVAVAGDFDHDGLVDLAIGARGAGTVSLLVGPTL